MGSLEELSHAPLAALLRGQLPPLTTRGLSLTAILLGLTDPRRQNRIWRWARLSEVDARMRPGERARQGR
jgi:hypothetical protein